MDVNAFGPYAEAGVWTLAGLTIFDEASNRLDLTTTDLRDAGLPTTLTVVNAQGDATAPTLDGFTILTPSVTPATGNARFSVQVRASDAQSGVSVVRVDFISPRGVIVSASQTLATPTASATLQLDTPVLSAYLEDGLWSVYGLMLTDGAGNSVQLGEELDARGYATTLVVTNPTRDITAPELTSLTVLTPTVAPSSGAARISFAVTATDDLSGVKRVHIELRGPSNQILVVSGDVAENAGLAVSVQLDSAVLSTLLEHGDWVVDVVEITDHAGNSIRRDPATVSGSAVVRVRP
jgi:hypothetical protein